MADVVGTSPGEGRDRGQLIIVTGLLVAVAIVGLVLVLNAAIYSENLASRGADQSGREAIEYRSVVADAVSGLVEAENDQGHGGYPAVEGDVRDGIDRVDNYTARSYAARGTVVRIDRSSIATTEGTLVRQTNDSREFRNASGDLTDWTVATNVDRVRDVQLTVDRANLSSNVGDAMTVRVGSGLDTWDVVIYEDGGTNVTVATSIDGAAPVDVCSVAGTAVTIDLGRATVAGQPCPGLIWAEDVATPYDVQVLNGEHATGTYHATLDATSGTVDTGNVTAGPSETVHHVPAVYAVGFDVHFETSTLRYRDRVRVAPGESP